MELIHSRNVDDRDLRQRPRALYKTHHHRIFNMKRLLFAAALAVTTLPALATDVGVSISIGQPGFYGQIDIGGYPPPQMIYSAPRVMYQSAMYRPPIYMNVPRATPKTGASTAAITTLRRTRLLRAERLV